MKTSYSAWAIARNSMDSVNGLLMKVVAAACATISGLFVFKFVRRLLLKYALRTAHLGDKKALIIMKYLGGKNPSTLEFQDLLPHLPVPTLKKTLQRWLESVEPLVSAEDFAKAKIAAKELEESEEGAALQKVLEKRAREKENWLTDWWVEFAYLRQRAPLPANVSFFSTDTFDNMYGEVCTPDPIRRCADLIYAQLDFKQRVDEGIQLPLRAGGVVPVCMEGYLKTFGSTRVPDEPCDILKTYVPPKGGNGYVLLMIGSTMFRLPVIVDGKRVPIDSLVSAIGDAQAAAKSAKATKWGEGTWAQPNISLLTSRERTAWAKNRNAIAASSRTNAESMEYVEQALFSMVLHEKSSGCGPKKSNQFLIDEAFHGDGTRIWFDKGFTIIIFTDGRAAWNYEHTYADAPVPALTCEHSLIYSNPRSQAYRVYESPKVQLYERPVSADLIQWESDNLPDLETWLQDAHKEFEVMVSDLYLSPLYHHDFGVDGIKTCKVSPDGFCQAALQVASLKYFGRHVLTYESASLRSYKSGRTETIRSATADMLAFARAFVAEEHRTPEGKAKVAKLLRKAGATHSSISRAAMRGEGCDRHLLGLKLAALTTGAKMPSLFYTAAYNMEYELATSQSPLNQEHHKAKVDNMTQGGGFGPVSNPGVGCSYHPQKDRLYFNISVRSKDPKQDHARFAKYLKEALIEMYDIGTSVPVDKGIEG